MKTIVKLLVIGLLWASGASAYSGSCGIWAHAKGKFIAKNFPGTQAGYDSAKVHVGTNGVIFIYGGCEGTLTIGTLSDSVFVYTYDSARWVVYGKSGAIRDRAGTTRLLVDSLGVTAANAIISRLGPASSAGSGGATRILDGPTFALTGAGIQAAYDDLPSTGGKLVLPGGTIVVTQTLNFNKSNTVVEGNGTELLFQPTDPVTHDRCIKIHGDASGLRPVTGSIAKGDSTFVATVAGDVTDLVANDWLIVQETDAGLGGEIVFIDWVQVRSVAGTTIKTQHPFRMAFPATHSTINFRRVTSLLQNVTVRDLRVRTTNLVDNLVGVNAGIARNVTIHNVTSAPALGNAFFSYRTSGLTLSDCRQERNNGQSTELAATTDLNVHGCTFATHDTTSQTGGFTLDFGTAFFSITNNIFEIGANTMVQLLWNVHDGVFASNSLGYTYIFGDVTGQGLNLVGAARVAVVGNTLAGGKAAGTGIGVTDATIATPDFISSGNFISSNVVNGYGTSYVNVSGSTDVFLGQQGNIPFVTPRLGIGPAPFAGTHHLDIKSFDRQKLPIHWERTGVNNWYAGPDSFAAGVDGWYVAFNDTVNSAKYLRLRQDGPVVTPSGIVPARLGPASSAGSGGAIRIVDGVTFPLTGTGFQSALNDLPTVGGLVYVPSSYAGSPPSSIPPRASILTNQAPGQTVLRGNRDTNSGKLVLWNEQDFSQTSAIPYDSTVVMNQFSVNLRGVGATKIPVGIFSWVNVEGDMSAGAASKNPNAVFGQIDVNGPSPLPASYGDVAGEFAIVLRGTSATALPDERAVFGRINGDANQPITRAVGVFGSVSTTASAITDAHSFYGTAPVLSAPGTIANSVTARFDQPSSATTTNRSLHAGGESSFGGTFASPRVLIDRAAGGQVIADSLRANRGIYVGGQFVTKIILPTELTFPIGSVAAQATFDTTLTVSGVDVASKWECNMSPVSADMPANVGVCSCRVSADNAVKVRFINTGLTAANIPSQTWRVRAFK